MELHLFGATTPSGEAFSAYAQRTAPACSLHCYSRDSAVNSADFNNPTSFRAVGNPGSPSIWVSFGPIWLFASFLENLAREQPGVLSGLNGLIVCSSSSVITKRFAANNFDRELVVRLRSAEDQVLTTCRQLQIPCHILQPTLIYGNVGKYCDRNVSLLLTLLRRLPILPLPANTGLRQPIHARQLALVALQLALRLSKPLTDSALSERIPLGGDVQLSYREMIKALQQSQPRDDFSRRCLLLPIPNRLFFLLAIPLLAISPKSFEAVLRIGADLAGFIPSYKLTDESPQPFPLKESV